MLVQNAGAPPLGACIYRAVCPRQASSRLTFFRGWILLLTFFGYACYHMSRKPISIVKTELLNCSFTSNYSSHATTLLQHREPGNCSSFINEMNGKNPNTAKHLEGTLDTSYLCAYSVGMFVSGFVAERLDLRYFLSCGMLLSGLLTMAFGCAYYAEIHSIKYFIVIQVLCGFVQSTGWPGVVTVVANWFGKGKKGLIFGIWNSHTSIGNIMGSLLAGAFVEYSWGLSFIVPGLVIATLGVVFFFVLVPHPENVDLSLDSEVPEENTPLIQDTRDGDSASLRSSSMGDLARSLAEIIDIEAQIAEQNTERAPQEHEYNVRVEEDSDDSLSPSPVNPEKPQEGAISLLGALRIPGVVEFSLCLFFAKLVSYTFLYWLPSFIKEAGDHVSPEDAAYMSTLFDIGGILGGIFAGILSDYTGKSASTCAIMLVLAIPVLYLYQTVGQICPLDMSVKNSCYSWNVFLLLLCGLLVNGPYALITTAVSADLGTHPSLAGSAKALATVTAIIDGTGSVGAAMGPLIASEIPFEYIFYALMLADACALLLLSRLIYREVLEVCRWLRSRYVAIS